MDENIEQRIIEAKERWDGVIQPHIEANIASGILTARDYMITITPCEPKYRPK